MADNENKVPDTGDEGMENNNQDNAGCKEDCKEMTQKKHGVLGDVGIGVKIGVGLVFGAVAFAGGFLVKKIFFSGHDSNAIEAEGTVSDPVDSTVETGEF